MSVSICCVSIIICGLPDWALLVQWPPPHSVTYHIYVCVCLWQCVYYYLLPPCLSSACAVTTSILSKLSHICLCLSVAVCLLLSVASLPELCLYSDHLHTQQTTTYMSVSVCGCVLLISVLWPPCLSSACTVTTSTRSKLSHICLCLSVGWLCVSYHLWPPCLSSACAVITSTLSKLSHICLCLSVAVCLLLSVASLPELCLCSDHIHTQ